MRTVAVTLAATLAVMLAGLLAPPGAVGIPLARAEAPKPLNRKAPPSGLFFDDPVAIAPDGKTVAVLSTDAATVPQLELWFPAAKEGEPSAARAPETPPGIVELRFLGPNRLLLVSKKEGSDKRTARIAEIAGGPAGATRITIGKRVIGPADSIELIERDGKSALSLYSRSAKKGGVEHSIQLLALDGQKSLGRRSLAEDAEGQIKGRAGAIRPLWWSRGHTELSAQKLGEYDKARDIRRPHRFIKLDALTDKILVEHEIEDLLGYAKAGLAHKAVPDAETFVSLSEDQKELVLHDGLQERVIPLSRPLDVYDKSSLITVPLDGQRLLVGLQVDANNMAAIARKKPDPDEIDLYVVDRGAKDAFAKRVLVLSGEGRSAAFTAAADRLLVLRKGKGFDRGGVAIEVYSY